MPNEIHMRFLNSLPSQYHGYSLCLNGETVHHFRAGQDIGSSTKVGVADLRKKMVTSHALEHEAIIEVSPALLADDIVGCLARLRDPFDPGRVLFDPKEEIGKLCRSIIFCPGILYQSMVLVDNFIHRQDSPGAPYAIYINALLPGGGFRQGLAFFGPLADSLAHLEAETQTNSEAARPFLYSLYAALSTKALLDNFPVDPAAEEFRGHYERQYQVCSTHAQVYFSQKIIQGLAIDTLRLYSTLSAFNQGGFRALS